MAESTAEEQPATIKELANGAWDALEGTESEEPEPSVSEQSEEQETEASEEAAPEEEASGEQQGEEPEAEEAEAAESEEQAEEPAIELPQHWSDEFKEEVSKLPNEAQQKLVERHKEMEADYTRKTQEIADIRKALEPYRQQLDLQGINDGDYVRQLAAADNYLRQNPVEGIQHLMNQYGISPEQIAGETEEEDFSDPEVKKLREQNEELKRKIESIEQYTQTTEQQRYQEQINQFANAQDDSGNLKHPYFEDVKTDMGLLLEQGRANDLETAYDMAVHMNPEVRQKVINTKPSEPSPAPKKSPEQKRKAATPKSAGTDAPPKEPARDLRTELEAQMNQ